MNGDPATPDLIQRLLGTRSWATGGVWWMPVRVWAGSESKPDSLKSSAVVRKPCGCLSVLSKHHIGPGGVVTPSVACRGEDGKRCPIAYHDYLRLVGWEP